jgi:hypothetical protein
VEGGSAAKGTVRQKQERQPDLHGLKLLLLPQQQR